MRNTKTAPGMERAFELRSELFDLANKYALEGNGEAAGHLHEACNCVLRANNILNGLPDREPTDVLNQAMNSLVMSRLGL
jgi:hypothetical protein